MQEHCQGSDAAVFTLDTTTSYNAVVGYFAFHGKQRKSIFEENKKKRDREREREETRKCVSMQSSRNSCSHSIYRCATWQVWNSFLLICGNTRVRITIRKLNHINKTNVLLVTVKHNKYALQKTDSYMFRLIIPLSSGSTRFTIRCNVKQCE